MAFLSHLPPLFDSRKHVADPDARALALRQTEHAPILLDTGAPESVPGHEERGFWP